MAEATETVSQEQPKVNVFDDNSNKIVIPQTEEKKDPVIEEKDKKIEEEKPVITKTNEPEKTPKASPKDIPERTEAEKDVPKSEVKFANKTSEKIFNLLTAEGKTEQEAEDALFDYLSVKKTLATLDKLPAAEKIKLQLKNENKDYSAEEINDLFNETYVMPEKPEQGIDETDDDFAAREKKYNDKVTKLERRIERESKKATAELLKQNEKLVFPEIPKPELKANEPSQEELDAIAKARENYLTSIGDGLDNFKSIDATVLDKDGKVQMQVSYKVNAEESKELRQIMENFNLEQFIQDRWLTKDGKFNTLQQAKDILQLTKGEEITAKLVNEAIAKKEAEVRKSVRNVDYSTVTKSGNFSPSYQEEIDKAAKHFFAN